MPHPVFKLVKNSDIFTQIREKQPSPTPVVARFRDTYAPTSKKYVSTDPRTRLFQSLNKKCFKCHSYAFRFQKQRHFHSNSERQPFPTPVVARFKDMYKPTSRKYNSTDPKIKPF